MVNFAVSATAITAITPACTGSDTTRSAASGTLPAMLRLITSKPCARTSRTAFSISPPVVGSRRIVVGHVHAAAAIEIRGLAEHVVAARLDVGIGHAEQPACGVVADPVEDGVVVGIGHVPMCIRGGNFRRSKNPGKGDPSTVINTVICREGRPSAPHRVMSVYNPLTSDRLSNTLASLRTACPRSRSSSPRPRIDRQNHHRRSAR